MTNKISEITSQVRVRFAPSPTGEMHIGSLRTALYNFLYARHTKGSFILRIEDTDQTRKVEGAVERLIATLERFTLTPDEGVRLKNGKCVDEGEFGPYTQSQRTDIYRQAAETLLETGHAYYCFCTTERLDSLREIQQKKGIPTRYDGHCRSLEKEEIAQRMERGEQHVVRLKVPHTGSLSFTDAIRGNVSFAYETIDDQVLIKSDGFPTYHLANVVDDHEMKISHVIRGEEWLPSTPKHLLLYSFFGWDAPEFAHLPILLDTKRGKLSKRKGAKSAEEYLQMGILPEALLNFILFLGWNPKTNEEIFSLEKMVEVFSLENINMSGAIVNEEKLRWMNSQYLRLLSVDDVTEYCLENNFLSTQYRKSFESPQWKKFLSLILERLEILSELESLTGYFFVQPEYTIEMLLNNKYTTHDVFERLETVKKIVSLVENWESKSIEDFRALIEESVVKEKGFDRGSVLWPLRVALTGSSFSPGAYELLGVLSQKVVLERISHAIRLCR